MILVLLKNGENADAPVLPLPKKASGILVAASHATNLGYQCGGWTATWQGVDGNNYIAGIIKLLLLFASISSKLLLNSNIIVGVLMEFVLSHNEPEPPS